MQALVLAAVLAIMVCGSGLAADLVQVAPARETAGPSQANVINPYELLSFTRDQLAQRFPTLSAAELDKLVFKIADINSMRSLAR